MLCCLQIVFKDGGSAFELYRCRTASCDPLSLSLSFFSTLSQGVKTSAAGDSQQAQMFAVQELLLLHNNAHPHSALAAIEAIRRLKFELLPHLPYKRGFACRKFAGDDEVKDAVHTWLRSQLKKKKKTFFADGIRRLENHKNG